MTMALVHLASLLLLTSTATASVYKLKEVINSTNFYGEFDFLTKGRNPAKLYDDNDAWVRYQSLEEARAKNLTDTTDGLVYLGVDHTTVLDPDSPVGRDAFRVQSRKKYNKGLFIMRYTHLPKPVCGAWPAVWTVGDGPWPVNGEIDLYEGWNLNTANRPSFHAGTPDQIGNCRLHHRLQGGEVVSANCDNSFDLKPDQPAGQGCQVKETNNTIWGSETGGIQALLWTDTQLSIWTWPSGLAPLSLDADQVQVDSTWGRPSLHLALPNCNVTTALTDQRLILNVAFCGGLQWGEGTGGPSCEAETRQTCEEFVARNPAAFSEVYFRMRDFRYLEMADVAGRSLVKRPVVKVRLDFFGFLV
ncbi:beta-1,3-endoglucanase [Ophiocordyceps camponoti-floridani]|uniref:Beta-1,3-endoglucanase n=1 Tax=Ophiocordyceps camponoti-floridani TaxID=2030778 RepID=A0A8H4Q6W5_9HYPO|nr:beta-1,3-endoglucanase [Ophiocordyceps camponoti-floridani]